MADVHSAGGVHGRVTDRVGDVEADQRPCGPLIQKQTAGASAPAKKSEANQGRMLPAVLEEMGQDVCSRDLQGPS